MTPEDVLASFPNDIRSALRRMEPFMTIVEEELAARGLTKARTESDKSLFAICCPSQTMERLQDEDLYREHVVELLERHLSGEDLRTGTKLEVAMAMLQTALSAPLNREGLATLFVATRGSKLESMADGWDKMERFEGSGLDNYNYVAKKLAVEERR